jgi:hypothetical protein
MKKENFKRWSFLLQIWKLKYSKGFFQCPHGCPNPYPYFCLAKEKWSRLFAIFFLQCILKTCLNPTIIVPNMEGSKSGKKMLLFASTPHPHLHLPRKNGKRFLNFLFGGCFHLQYLPLRKETSKGD